jgi:D-alanyl-D-alanine carboxypeptidase (penicillin-binding protein 5/6)
VTSPGTPPIPPDVQAGSFVLADEATGAILAERAPHERLRPASTLKVLTALALMPRLDPAAVHVAVPGDISALATAEPGASAVGIKPGLSYRVSDLWNGVFLRSGNDAIATLANLAGGEPATVDLMRQTAQRLHADDTVVVNADGYDADGQVSSSYDLALMARAGLQDPGFRAYCSLEKAKFPSVNGTTYEIDNENHLLGKYPGMIGVKNGYTSLAHHTFVGAAERNGRTLVVSVFDAGTDIYQQTAKLLDWGFALPANAAGVDELVSPDTLPRSSVPNEQLPPPLAGQHLKKPDAESVPGGLPSSAAASAPHKDHGSSLVGDVVKTLFSILGFLVLAVVALRTRVLMKQRKER